MHVTSRSYLTAGIAALGVGAIALSPIQPIPSNLPAAQERVVSDLAVTLAATIDPITPWVDTFKLAAANIMQLGAFYADKPFPILQAIGANAGTYFNELTNGNAALIPGQIQNNLKTFFEAPWWNKDGQLIPTYNGATPPGPVYYNDYISDTITSQRTDPNTADWGLFNSQSTAYAFAAPLLGALLPSQLPEQLQPAVVPVLQFLATPYSGQLLGLLSPTLSSLVQLTRSFTAVGEYFQAGDTTAAINELINIPANTTNANLNGAGLLDLTAVVKGLLPAELQATIKSFGLQLGGMLSPPVPFNNSLLPNGTAPTVFTGGTFFDAVEVEAGGFSASTGRCAIASLCGATTGLPVGWGQSVIGLGQFLGQELVVTPPPPTAAAAPAAAEAAAPTAEVAAAAADDTADVVADIAPEPEAPSGASNNRAAAASDNSGNDNGGKTSSRASRSGRGSE